MEDILLQKQMEVQMELAMQKVMGELRSIKDDLKNLHDEIASVNRQLRNGNIPSSPPSRGDFQVSPPTTLAPSGQGQNFGQEGHSHNYQPQQSFQPRPVRIDENQGGFTGAAVAETTRGRGNNLPGHLTMDKVFYCGGKR